MRKLALSTLVVAFSLLGLSAPARAVDPQEAGEMAAQIDDSQREVKEKYGNRKPREMDQEERHQYEKDLNAARDKVLTEHNTSLRDYETSKLKMGREGLQKSKDAQDGWGDKKKAKAEADKKAADEKAAKDKEPEIQVQRGFDERKPPAGDDDLSKMHEIPVPKDDKPAE